MRMSPRMCYRAKTVACWRVALSYDRQVLKLPISGAQIRAARALLKWSVRELSARCRVSHSAISRCEKVDDTPPMQERILNAIKRTLEEHGIDFLGLNGVRLRPGSSNE
jgi:hypothetical protein